MDFLDCNSYKVHVDVVQIYFDSKRCCLIKEKKISLINSQLEAPGHSLLLSVKIANVQRSTGTFTIYMFLC